MAPAETLLAELVAAFLAAVTRTQGDNLRVALHFGSTVKGLVRHDTDVDLIMGFRKVPSSRFDRLCFLDDAETQVSPIQKRLLDLGYHVELSPIVRTVAEFECFSPLYLDMTWSSAILFDPDNLGADVLKKTAAWIQTSGARRVQRGELWYWELKPDYKPGDQFKVGF